MIWVFLVLTQCSMEMQRGVRGRRSHGNRAKCSFSTCSAAGWTHRSEKKATGYIQLKGKRYCPNSPMVAGDCVAIVSSNHRNSKNKEIRQFHGVLIRRAVVLMWETAIRILLNSIPLLFSSSIPSYLSFYRWNLKTSCPFKSLQVFAQ